jgi:hypothetical protein
MMKEKKIRRYAWLPRWRSHKKKERKKYIYNEWMKERKKEKNEKYEKEKKYMYVKWTPRFSKSAFKASS